MEEVITIESLRYALKQWRLQGDNIAFVPTMGNLHAGHISLVTTAQQKAQKVVVSIFVNPTQFEVGEDFHHYPKTIAKDKKKLQQAGVDLLFLPAVREVYAHEAKTIVSLPELSTLHCGISRPNHFEGVAMVVTKLFNMVQPDLSVFGNKDFQQLLLIQTLVQDLNMPIEIINVDTVREADGLAISSRNSYLSTSERRIAPQLYIALCTARDAIFAGKLNFRTIEQQHLKQLNSLGFKADYFVICRCHDLQPASNNDKNLRIMVAAKLGNTRLIDNIGLLVNEG